LAIRHYKQLRRIIYFSEYNTWQFNGSFEVMEMHMMVDVIPEARAATTSSNAISRNNGYKLCMHSILLQHTVNQKEYFGENLALSSASAMHIWIQIEQNKASLWGEADKRLFFLF
jgi:hypothetical protein